MFGIIIREQNKSRTQKREAVKIAQKPAALVMAGLVPAIHASLMRGPKTWMPATGAGMTTDETYDLRRRRCSSSRGMISTKLQGMVR